MKDTYSAPEIIVVAKTSAALRSPKGMPAVSAGPGAKVSGLNSLLKSSKLSLEPLFGDNEAAVRAVMSEPMMKHAGGETPDPGSYYVVSGEVKNPKKLIADLLNEETIEGAYLKPGGEPPVYREEGEADGMPAPTDGAPAPTPDFNARQIYLGAAPAGIDARFAWTKPGGRGDGGRVIDLEWGWNFSHEDLLANSGGLLDGTNSSNNHHGTAVLGEIGGDHNSLGVMGIAPNAKLSTISFVTNPSAAAIRKAADRLGPGDIILLEIHRAGPRHNFQARDDQLGYIGIEWWPDDFAAILYATSKGILVVEAAGNGAENLDDALYSVRPNGFPQSWRNPFNRNNPQCGAILVGAGAPPPGTHGRNHGADRSRLGFSNYGSAVDCQGWGREVTTTGYGDLQNNSSNTQYTDTFSGTSSASPIVVGALGCAQGWLRAAGKPLMTPASARQMLRNTGSPQQDEPGRPVSQRIGKRPNLREIHGKLFPKPILKETLKEIKDKDLKEKDLKDHLKDHKEKDKDIKEIKDKDLKDKDIKEIKEKDLKDVKEIEKPIKEKDKDKDVFEGGFDGGVIRTPAEASGSEARLAALEATVQSLAQMLQLQGLGSQEHFIPESLRPLVGGGTDDGSQDQ
ncbi:S8 family peptidase [Roseateles sp. DB2]|uniref:S8 family peptidase n=1 Tax=Roseateles sp. DB2 TaxID=3453717 RepID=UPI003EEE3686